MPLTQPERDNPLMRRYFREIGLPGQQLAKRCGVSHSQIYMARKRNVGANNARKIARGVARILGLSDGERLELAAGIMGHPGEMVRAYLGSQADAMRFLRVPEHTASELISEEKSVTHQSGTRALARLREMGAPDVVVGSVERRLMPPPERPRGVITHDLHGSEMAEQRKRTREGLRYGKRKTYEALQRSGFVPKDIRRRAGVGRETVRKALYERCGRRAAKSISRVLGDTLGLSDEERETIRGELMRCLRRIFCRFLRRSV
jgi:hypothetical protein